jgi:hypothetical protein
MTGPFEILEHPGYRVWDDGRVESDILLGSKSRRRTGDWKPVKPYVNKKWKYLYVDLRSGEKRRSWRVHVLVMRAFGPPKPGDGFEVRHLDGIRENNQIGNLAWGTRSDNMQDAVRHGTIKRGVRQENAKLDDDKVREIRRLLASGFTQSSLSSTFGVSGSVISEINTGKAWKHVLEAAR